MKNIKKIINVGLVAVPLVGEVLYASDRYPMPLTVQAEWDWESIYNQIPNFKMVSGFDGTVGDYYLLAEERYQTFCNGDLIEFVDGEKGNIANKRVNSDRYKHALEFVLFVEEGYMEFQKPFLEIMLGRVKFMEITNGGTVADFDLLFDGIDLKDDIKTTIHHEVVLFEEEEIGRMIGVLFTLRAFSSIVNGLAEAVTEEVSSWKKMGAQLDAFTGVWEAKLRALDLN